MGEEEGHLEILQAGDRVLTFRRRDLERSIMDGSTLDSHEPSDELLPLLPYCGHAKYPRIQRGAGPAYTLRYQEWCVTVGADWVADLCRTPL